MYVSVSEYAISRVLVAEREKNQLSIYYISRAFRGFEGNYSKVEKVLFAVVMASRKLKPYFQSHQIRVMTNQLLKKILKGRNHSNRICDCANQLADYGIEFELHTLML